MKEELGKDEEVRVRENIIKNDEKTQETVAKGREDEMRQQ